MHFDCVCVCVFIFNLISSWWFEGLFPPGEDVGVKHRQRKVDLSPSPRPVWQLTWIQPQPPVIEPSCCSRLDRSGSPVYYQPGAAVVRRPLQTDLLPLLQSAAFKFKRFAQASPFAAAILCMCGLGSASRLPTPHALTRHLSLSILSYTKKPLTHPPGAERLNNADFWQIMLLQASVQKDDEWEEDEALSDRGSSEALFGCSY